MTNDMRTHSDRTMPAALRELLELEFDYAAIWCVRPEKKLLDQPIVFFGSEGAVGVVARDFASFLWLLAGGFGPLEAVEFPGLSRETNPEFTAFARRHAGVPPITPNDVIANARQEFPAFEEQVRSLCR